ncbi:hypothetical protein UY416_08305 [Paenibacillus polymyxa]|uniref:hypothetical protein n=1 Tax=Paenibacillus polymyxa TaxID=1406 RepID=UPI0029D46896|nr:hypothetical protein [Paenibacillus polymyxa]MCF2720001.1 hypothetical protein [Paenibacillus sp. UKAQ_18]MDY8046291.1 hypothetical protein [Paenibacillus polymyxa]
MAEIMRHNTLHTDYKNKPESVALTITKKKFPFVNSSEILFKFDINNVSFLVDIVSNIKRTEERIYEI